MTLYQKTDILHKPDFSPRAVIRRKLAVAISIIGLPSVVMMDDPAVGLDFIAKRKIYRTILLIRQLVKSAVLVVTHSMSDCVVMSDRMAIMLNGQFQCIGNVKDLKARLCRGFVILVQLKYEVPRNRATFMNIGAIVNKSFPKSSYNGRLGNSLEYVVEVTEPWSDLVRIIYDLRPQLETYASDVILSEMSLEHVLLKIAKYQKPKKLQLAV